MTLPPWLSNHKTPTLTPAPHSYHSEISTVAPHHDSHVTLLLPWHLHHGIPTRTPPLGHHSHCGTPSYDLPWHPQQYAHHGTYHSMPTTAPPAQNAHHSTSCTECPPRPLLHSMPTTAPPAQNAHHGTSCTVPMSWRPHYSTTTTLPRHPHHSTLTFPHCPLSRED